MKYYIFDIPKAQELILLANSAFVKRAKAIALLEAVYTHSILIKAYHLNKDFETLYEAKSSYGLYALVRIQLENVFNLYGCLICGNREQFMKRFLANNKNTTNQMKTKSKQPLTTSFIKTKLGEYLDEVETINRIYQEGNNIIHPTNLAYELSATFKDRQLTLIGFDKDLLTEEQRKNIFNDMIIVNNYLMEVMAIYVKAQLRFDELASNVKSEPAPPDEAAKVSKRILDIFKPINKDLPSE